MPEETQEVVPVAEVKEKRTEYAKHFRMSDGTYQMIAYPVPVHYQANPGWEEIDNTLKEESGAIVTANSPAPVSFGLHTQDDLLTIGKEDQAISFQLMGQKIGKSKVKAKNTRIKTESKTSQSENLFGYEDRLESEVLYPEILSNVDVKYEVIGNSVKESILIKNKKGSKQFQFKITGACRLNLLEDNSIEVFKGEELIYTIDAPYMFDANGAYSDDIRIKLQEFPIIH